VASRASSWEQTRVIYKIKEWQPDGMDGPKSQVLATESHIWQGSLYIQLIVYNNLLPLASTQHQNVKWSRKQRHPRATGNLSSKYEPSDTCLLTRKLYKNQCI
jgi:hypothetical protein